MDIIDDTVEREPTTTTVSGGCGCGCCGPVEPKPRSQEIAELRQLKEQAEQRLAELQAE